MVVQVFEIYALNLELILNFYKAFYSGCEADLLNMVIACQVELSGFLGPMDSPNVGHAIHSDILNPPPKYNRFLHHRRYFVYFSFQFHVEKASENQTEANTSA